MLDHVSDGPERNISDMLAAFCSHDDLTSNHGFGQLAEVTRRGLHAYLRTKLHSVDAREDVVQEVLRRIWSRRSQFQNRGVSAWWRLVKQAADQCRIDYVRKVGAERAWDDSETGEIPATETVLVDDFLDSLVDRKTFYRFADELWLGFDPSLSEQQRTRRILAAELFYIEGMTWDEVCAILNRNESGPVVSRAELDVWLEAATTIRSLAFRMLYRTNEELAGHLLGIASASEADLNQVTVQAMSSDRAISTTSAWTREEIRVILWRYRDAERQDRILAHELCLLDKSEMANLFDRCLENFPFVPLMKRLCHQLAKWPKAQQELTDQGLWQRLVFEYYCRETTQHRDIYERTANAAELAPYHLTMGMLNVWLSNGRLMAKLANYAASHAMEISRK